MLDFVIFALTVIVFLIITIIYLYPGSKRTTTIPGPDITDPLEGNLPEVASCGSLHEFLQDLHKTYGPITAFWLGPQFCVSIASPELLKEQANTFDRPKSVYELLEPLITQHSIQYANGVEGRRRHTAYSRCFSHGALEKRYQILQKYSKEFCTKWASLAKEEHIPLTEYMFAFAIRSILAVAFGGYFADSKEVLKFKNAYDHVWSEMESRLSSDPPTPSREENFEKSKTLLYKMLKDAASDSKKNIKDLDSEMFVKVVQEVNNSSEVIDADSLTVCVGGFHTTGLLLSWCVYFLATNPEVQEKLYREVTDLVGEEDILYEAIGQLVYLRQVLDETLRCSKLSTQSTRVQDIDIQLGGHKVPAGTPVLQAMGVMFEDENLWPDPEKFDPERFSPENRKSIPSCGFEPFGFAGKRKCPGYRLSYVEASLLLGDLVRKFKLNMVEGQVVQPSYSLVTGPKEEIWITLEKRK